LYNTRLTSLPAGFGSRITGDVVGVEGIPVRPGRDPDFEADSEESDDDEESGIGDEHASPTKKRKREGMVVTVHTCAP
jgi:hypothetical protein